MIKFLLILMLIIPAAISAQTAQVKKAVNEVSYTPNGQNTSAPAKSGQWVNSGDEITTGEKGLATILFIDDKSLLVIRPNSNVEIRGDKVNKIMSKNTVLNKGKLGFNISHRKDQDYTFTTPTAVASIRGTQGTIESSDDGTFIYIDSGAVEIQANLGEKKTGRVESGQFAKIDNEGNVEVDKGTLIMQQDFKKSTITNTKTLRIVTDKGTIIIEYIPEEK